MLTAAVPVHIEHLGWRLTRFPVLLHQASCYGVKCLSLTSCQNRDKDLTVLVSNIGAPGRCTCSSTSKFLPDLFRKDKELNTVHCYEMYVFYFTVMWKCLYCVCVCVCVCVCTALLLVVVLLVQLH